MTVSRSMTQRPAPVASSSRTLLIFVSLWVTRVGMVPSASPLTTAPILSCLARQKSISFLASAARLHLSASRDFKKFSKRCGDKIDRAVEIYRKIAERHVQEGDLMKVDPVKLEAILAVAETKHAMLNLRNGKYELK